jgi:hypothetical protein
LADLEKNGITRNEIRDGLLPLLADYGVPSRIVSITTDSRYRDNGFQKFDGFIQSGVPMIVAVSNGYDASTRSYINHAVVWQLGDGGVVRSIDPAYNAASGGATTGSYPNSSDAYDRFRQGGNNWANPPPGYIIVPK